MAQIDAFSEQRRVKNSQLKTVVRTLLTLLRTGLKKNAVAKQIYEEFVQLGLANEKAEEIATLWNANLVNMSRSLVGQTLSVNKLVDLDWRFGGAFWWAARCLSLFLFFCRAVTAGTDSLRQAGTTFLQLKLALDKGNSQTESVFMGTKFNDAAVFIDLFFSFFFFVCRAHTATVLPVPQGHGAGQVCPRLLQLKGRLRVVCIQVQKFFFI